MGEGELTKWEVDENDLGIVVKEGNDWVVRTTRTWGDPEGICVRKYFCFASSFVSVSRLRTDMFSLFK